MGASLRRRGARAVLLCSAAAVALGLQCAVRRPVAPVRRSRLVVGSAPAAEGEGDGEGAFVADGGVLGGGEEAAALAAPVEDDLGDLLGEDDLSDLLGDEDDALDVDADAAAAAPPPEEEDDDAGGLAELLRLGDAGGDAEALEAEWQRRKEEMDDAAERKKRREEKRLADAEAAEKERIERGIGLLRDDPLCRGVVVCITRGTEADNATVYELETALKAAHGDRVELAHNVDHEPEEDMPLFEVWLEGYRYMVLHARNWQDDGDLTPEKIAAIVDTVGAEITDDAALVLGTYPEEDLE